ncbi:uncharacterized protein Dana_GF20369 [Drosophila ananassae]|uniref:Uncharacterized protein n=1 Tax=Drosophila ananassae TaxID=7217 RepID=B3MQ33_DROAN|nr:uncharacterized protein LOC6503077 [Drosophila ananassae]EDV44459.1 uncharacterized protein Dana_GF20369 [Drosophila ananassae]
MLKLQVSMLILAFFYCAATTFGTPIAPATPDGATPIDARVSAAEFGAQDAFDSADSSGESAQAEASDSAGFKISLLPTPAKTAESVNLEQEAIPSKVLSLYDNGQKKLAEISQPVPILDTISEHEKYGNNGDMFDGISRSIVNGYEAFSNLLNTFIQKPKELARSVTKGITAQLDIIGGKLVGL